MANKTIEFLKHWWIPLALLILSPLFWVYAQSRIAVTDYLNYGIFQYWLAGRMILDGINPYDSAQWIDLHLQAGATWIPNNIFPYPLALTYLLAPMGLIPVKQSYQLAFFFAQIAISGSIFLLIDKWETAKLKIFAFPILISMILFYPILQSLANSSLSPFFLFALVYAIYAYEKKQSFWSGFLIGILMFKPTIGLTVCGLVGLWMLVRRDWKGIAGLATISALIFFISLLGDIHWVDKFIHAGAEHLQDTFQRQPTILNFGLSICNSNKNCAYSISAILVLVFTSFILYSILKKSGELSLQTVLSLATPLAMLIAPYIWPYEYVLLIIPFVFISEKLILLTKSFTAPTLFLGLIVLISSVTVSRGGDSSFYGIIIVPFMLLIVLMWLLLVNPVSKDQKL